MPIDDDRNTESAATGGEADADILATRFDDRTVGEHLAAAVADGHVLRNADGTLSLPRSPPAVDFTNDVPFARNCAFLNSFLFKHIYGSARVPAGCAECYKVKVDTRTMRALMAVKTILEDVPYPGKSVAEVDRRDNASLFASYLYTTGLGEARMAFEELRAKVDAHPALGPTVKMTIKRGCTNYERACGPSDRYAFDPRQKDVEAYFRKRFRRAAAPRPAREYLDAAALLEMARAAFRIGDETYKEFTGGKEILPATVSYAPKESVDGPS